MRAVLLDTDSCVQRPVENKAQTILEQECTPAHLVHDNEVDSVFLRVLVVAEAEAEALRVKALKVLRSRQQQ